MTLAAMLVLGVLAAAGSRVLANSYSNWAAIVVAGDWHAHDGSPSEIFDNARRDVSAALINIGFDPNNIMQFSVRPERYPGTLNADAAGIANSLWDLSNRTSGGCLLYFSSHGAPSGLVLGDTILNPDKLASIISNACGNRPTVVVISACYSGVFVGDLQGPDRMVVTAARPDRTSFGCGSLNKYPYFDTCFLNSIGDAHDFQTLAIHAKACVAKMEKDTKMSPPSDPQISVGSQIAGKLPAWR